MNTDAIIMMVIYLTVIWGALGLSLRHLFAHPDED